MKKALITLALVLALAAPVLAGQAPTEKQLLLMERRAIRAELQVLQLNFAQRKQRLRAIEARLAEIKQAEKAEKAKGEQQE